MKISYGGASIEISVDEIKALTVDELRGILAKLKAASIKVVGKVGKAVKRKR